MYSVVEIVSDHCLINIFLQLSFILFVWFFSTCTFWDKPVPLQDLVSMTAKMEKILESIAALSAEDKDRVAEACGTRPKEQPAAAAAAAGGHHTSQARIS